MLFLRALMVLNIAFVTAQTSTFLKNDMIATTYKSEECLQQLEFERSRQVSVWDKISPRIIHQKSSQLNVPYSVWDFMYIAHDLKIIYVANFKVAYSSVLTAFRALGGFENSDKSPFLKLGKEVNYTFEKELEAYPKNKRKAVVELSRMFKTYFLFTIVREPLGCAWSAYTEISHRQLLNTVTHAALLKELPCSDSDRYSKYLQLMAQGASLSSEGYHAWPQAMKTDLMKFSGRGFDYIGRLEDGRKMLFELLSLEPFKKVPVSKKKQFVSAFEDHSQQHPRDRQCDQDIKQNEAYLYSSPHFDMNYHIKVDTETACELYMTDFVCFGYKIPPHCLNVYNETKHQLINNTQVNYHGNNTMRGSLVHDSNTLPPDTTSKSSPSHVAETDQVGDELPRVTPSTSYTSTDEQSAHSSVGEQVWCEGKDCIKDHY